MTEYVGRCKSCGMALYSDMWGDLYGVSASLKVYYCGFFRSQKHRVKAD